MSKLITIYIYIYTLSVHFLYISYNSVKLKKVHHLCLVFRHFKISEFSKITGYKANI